MKEVKERGIPEVPQIYPGVRKAALARVPVIQADVKFDSVTDIATLFLVSTVPLFTSPFVTEWICVQYPATYLATLISESPLAAISGVRSLWGSHPILTMAVVGAEDLMLQYSAVFETFNGERTDVAVELGVKNSAVNGIVIPAVDVIVKVCPLIVPLPNG